MTFSPTISTPVARMTSWYATNTDYLVAFSSWEQYLAYLRGDR